MAILSGFPDAFPLPHSLTSMHADPGNRFPRQLEFLAGGGELGERIRTFAWSNSVLGPPESWPSGLRTSLRTLLTTQHPVFIFWGPELTCFYNDAYSRSLGPEKHPSILGMPPRRPGRKSGTSSARRSTR